MVKYRKIDDTEKRGRERYKEQTGKTPKRGSREEYAVRLAAIKVQRPKFVTDAVLKDFKAVWDSGNEDAIEEWKTWINSMKEYGDELGTNITTIMEQAGYVATP